MAFLDAAPLAPVILVTGAWGAIYYPTMQLGPSALISGKGESQVKWGQRSFGNLHEQSTIFLVALWMHALFVNVSDAAQMGWVYLFLRALYPFTWAVSGGVTMPPPPQVLLSTMPQYGIVLWLLGTTVARVNFGVDLKTKVGSNFLGCAFGVALFFACFIFNAAITQRVVVGCFKEKRKDE
mmetsp:Transcript_21202/g.34994  ORF Transcript_21202/g.34994 Transcript_21202/m.34994 type:complete len:181 (-) Transcript_21202:95-637(-)|eukprot:CAMPEP_0119318946 /NCGR_PEP_ID=MMETSP1333-20130426/48060_1 /TAXON_ID=418940 /ORGANISM="Scyphosphaera apsteinii, Strain RCC1455" /LENGTH=180 /DNA_ID=CAMNT_0007325259 /DNA_START=100 /DNA_END=642 /DNA_ORIENTATION=+